MYQDGLIKWQCRRGCLELDLLLKRYLEVGYMLADFSEKALFAELLKCEDDYLLAVLMGELKPDTEPMLRLVETIRGFVNTAG